IRDFSDVFRDAEPSLFRDVVDAGQTVRGFVAPVAYSRKALDELDAFVKQLGGAGIAWVEMTAEGARTLPVIRKAGPAALDALVERAGAEVGQTLFIVAGERQPTLERLGILRLELARRERWIPGDAWKFLW